jgi:WD40 repeat protein
LIQANIQKAEAEKQRKIADVNSIKAQQAAEEAKKQQKIAIEQAHAAELARKDAEEKRIQAEKAEKEAKIARDQATQSAKEARIAEAKAKENELKAIAATKEAQKQRYLAIAKAIALKSKEINDKQQRALLAQQGYNFNLKYSDTGTDFNNEIYNGLFGALKALDDPMTNSLNGHKSAARALVTSVKNNAIYSGGSDGRLILWTLDKSKWTADTLRKFTDYQIYSMDISNDGNLLVAGGLLPADRNANFVYLFDLRNPKAEPKKIFGFISDVENLCFTPDNNGFFARCNSGKNIMYSDLSTAKVVVNAKEKITSIDLSPDGTKLAGGGVNGNLFVWDVKNNYSVSSYSILNGRDILTVAYTPKGSDVIIGGENGELRIVNNGIVRRTLSGHSSHIEQIKFSHSGKLMATASKDKSIRLWNMDNLNLQPQVLNDHDWVWSMAYSPDDSQIMAGIHSIIQNIGPDDVDYTIHAWPTKISAMSSKLCSYINHNMTKEDWEVFIAEDLPYETTCAGLSRNDK